MNVKNETTHWCGQRNIIVADADWLQGRYSLALFYFLANFDRDIQYSPTEARSDCCSFFWKQLCKRQQVDGLSYRKEASLC